ncbi:glycosyltransferase [Klebsiella pneumoniae]|uniref:glycosyltransferase n=1 Tax=Klebsiella pneumoniae TaxID=573 RepID=UPI00177BCCFB|nr:glycosyltransferase [Klebsiella pneumoniae]MBD8334935.1 glycosyltransferase [Klebsiella pneumoniae]MBJ8185300.1 glycosyltransferase [Klebsiella pneumoniae]
MFKNSTKIAIVHDWLDVYAGAEKVLECLLSMFPNADLFCIVDYMPADKRGFLAKKKITTTFIQKFPFSKLYYRKLLPLMPFAIEQLDLTGYDIIISSSHAVAKGVITGPNQFHVCYCHTPIRYAWDMQNFYIDSYKIKNIVKKQLILYLLHRLRNWDYRSASGVDFFIANSTFVAQRIMKVYRRESIVIHPNVNINRFELSKDKKDCYFTVSRVVPHKNILTIVQAFKKLPEKKLLVIGDGQLLADLKKIKSDNIQLLGYQSDNVVNTYMSEARALIFAAEEDFGIVPVEAQACGTPVIALEKGGAVDTIVEGVTGIFYQENTPEHLMMAIQRSKTMPAFEPEKIRFNAERFSEVKFVEKIEKIVREGYSQFKSESKTHVVLR